MSGFKRKKCEICQIKTCRMDGQKRIFMARFPLEEDRCREWVAATGNKNLINVPIEKLNQLKYICGKHFVTKDFKKKKTQMVVDVDFTWMCKDHKETMVDRLLQRLSLLLIRNHCKMTNRSFALNEESSADFLKKAQLQSVAK